jgi:hypothetical protein
LIALPDEPYWVRTKLSSSRSWVEPDPNLPGTHRPEGIIALSGAGLTPGRHLQANLTDATPTILALLGLPIPAHIEGRPVVEPASLYERNGCTTAHHPHSPGLLEGPHRQAFEYTPEEQEVIEQRLAELGYLE